MNPLHNSNPIFHIYSILTNDVATRSVASKSSSSNSQTLPSINSTKHSRLSTPSFSSNEGKGKRPLSFSPISENLVQQSSVQQTEERLTQSTAFHILPPLVEQTNEVLCQWSNCDLPFSNPTQLTEHLRSVHIDRSDSRTWFCQWNNCSRNGLPFKSLYSLFLHVRTHTQDRPFQCSHLNCQKTFTRAEYLRLHERSHTGEKPYPCEYTDCSKSFSNPSDRTKHVKRTHLNKKEYVCQFPSCGKSYTDPSSLRKHVKTIHGEEAFRQKKHKKFDDFQPPPSNEQNQREFSSIENSLRFQSTQIFPNSSNVFYDRQNQVDDDDEEIIVDHFLPAPIDALRTDFEGLAVESGAVFVHPGRTMHSLKKNMFLPSIKITSAVEEESIKENESDPVFRHNQNLCQTLNPRQRISAHSASTAYSSMPTDSIFIENAGALAASNRSSWVSNIQRPSASPYEYDCPSNEKKNVKIQSFPSIRSSHSPNRISPLTSDHYLTLPAYSSTSSHRSTNFSNDFSVSSSFCMSNISSDQQQQQQQQQLTMSNQNSNTKMAHLLYFLETLDYDTSLNHDEIETH